MKNKFKSTNFVFNVSPNVENMFAFFLFFFFPKFLGFYDYLYNRAVLYVWNIFYSCSALVWGTSVKHNPQNVGKDHVLNDEDVVQVVKK